MSIPKENPALYRQSSPLQANFDSSGTLNISLVDHDEFENPDRSHFTTFTECFEEAVTSGRNYQNRIFYIMAAYWMVSSFFFYMPFFLFK